MKKAKSLTECRSVLVFARSEYRELFSAVCLRLRQEGTKHILLLCANADQANWYRSNHSGAFDEIADIRFFYDDLLDNSPRDEDKLASEAQAIEKRYGFSFTHLFMDNRHIGLGFSPGATNFPGSIFSRTISYPKALRAFIRLIRFYEDILDRRQVALVLNGDKSIAALVRARGIPQRIFTETRYKNWCYWAVNDVLESNLLTDALEATSLPDTAAPPLSPPTYYARARADALKRFDLSRMIYNVGYEVARKAWYRLRGYQKARGYLLKENMLAHWRIWAQYRELRRQRLLPLSALAEQSFIYFPLGVEPERSLTRDSPEFTNQFFALQTVAKDLPAGVLLAVKEHLTGIGPRPRDFYKSLAQMPNVVLLDPLEPGLEVIKAARAVATVTGTAGLEAAIMGVPVISFGRHNIYNVVPHVHPVTSWLEIPTVLDRILATSPEGAVARAREGHRFLNALLAISVDCGDADFNQPLDAPLVECIIALLDRTLAQVPATARATA